MKLTEIIRKNPLCLMSVYTTLNINDPGVTVPPELVMGFIGTDVKMLND